MGQPTRGTIRETVERCAVNNYAVEELEARSIAVPAQPEARVSRGHAMLCVFAGDMEDDGLCYASNETDYTGHTLLCCECSFD